MGPKVVSLICPLPVDLTIDMPPLCTHNSLEHSGPLLPTRTQEELDEEEEDDVVSSSARPRQEPRSVEEAGPLRVLYEGHDLLIIDKVGSGFNKNTSPSVID